ncbi:MAG: SEL1-like repeat protein, partial [Bdellovibrionales bacterium]
VTYFSNAAAQGVMEAAYNLGLIYENGLLGQPQPEAALMWYKAAADQGSPEARQALEELAKNLGISLEEVNRIVETMRLKDEADQSRRSSVILEPANPRRGGIYAAQDSGNEPTLATTTPLGADAFATPVSVTSGAPTQAIVAQVQEYLMRAGLYPGPADGVNGPLTEDAIRSYQSLNNLRPDGTASKDLLSHMLSNAGDLDTISEYGSRVN